MAGTVGGFLGPTQQSPGSEGFLSEEVTNLAGSQLAQGEVVRIVSDDGSACSCRAVPTSLRPASTSWLTPKLRNESRARDTYRALITA